MLLACWLPKNDESRHPNDESNPKSEIPNRKRPLWSTAPWRPGVASRKLRGPAGFAPSRRCAIWRNVFTLARPDSAIRIPGCPPGAACLPSLTHSRLTYLANPLRTTLQKVTKRYVFEMHFSVSGRANPGGWSPMQRRAPMQQTYSPVGITSAKRALRVRCRLEGTTRSSSSLSTELARSSTIGDARAADMAAFRNPPKRWKGGRCHRNAGARSSPVRSTATAACIGRTCLRRRGTKVQRSKSYSL